MSAHYRAVQWNRHKVIYDALAVGGAGAFLVVFTIVGRVALPTVTDEALLIRGLGALALALLHVVLIIGPLARVSPRFAPLLYNRRHLGVLTFMVGGAHATLVVLIYHGFADVNPLVSLLTANTRFGSVSQFPFELLGGGALVILFLMAATSHDFWLANLSPRWWKTLHMLVYAAYALLVGHVALGALQEDRHWLATALLGAGAFAIVSLHLCAGFAQRGRDRAAERAARDGWVEVCGASDIPEDRAVIICANGESIAVFRHDGAVTAMSNVCAHQGGPLGEGKVIDGCATCPWHGYQYRTHNGQSPPPYTEKLPTYDVRLEGDRVLVNPSPHAPGTATTPARIAAQGRAS